VLVGRARSRNDRHLEYPVATIVANPLELLAIAAFYGPAVLLIREALIRRRPGWTSLVLLGGAFGFVNEGVVAGTWYVETPDGVCRRRPRRGRLGRGPDYLPHLRQCDHPPRLG
jgi:hypothetical protein